MNVEIMVQRNASPALPSRKIKDLGIVRAFQPGLTGVQHIPTA